MLKDSKANKIFMLALVLVIALVTSIQYSGNKQDLANRNEQTFDLKSSDTLEINTVINDISVEIDPTAKQASASLGGEKTASLTVEKTGTKVSVKVTNIKRGFWAFSPTNTSRLVVTLPISYLASLSIATVSGDIDIMKDIESEKITVKSMSGNLDALNINAEKSISIATVSGDISCYSIASNDKVSVATTSGNIDINEIKGSTVELHSISSTFETTVQVIKGGDLNAASTSGDIQLDLKKTGNLSISATTISGDIVANTKEQEGHSFSDKTGEQNTKVSVKTVSGTIDLRY
jgi:hypothetical protein